MKIYSIVSTISSLFLAMLLDPPLQKFYILATENFVVDP